MSVRLVKHLLLLLCKATKANPTVGEAALPFPTLLAVTAFLHTYIVTLSELFVENVVHYVPHTRL